MCMRTCIQSAIMHYAVTGTLNSCTHAEMILRGVKDGMPRVLLAHRAKMSLHVKWEPIVSVLILSCLVPCLNAQGKMKD